MMRIAKNEIVKEINELLGECLSLQTEWALRRLTNQALFRMLDEIRRGKPHTLDHLLYVLNDAPRNTRVQQYAIEHGLPTKHGEIDMSGLPTFGGEEPSDVSGVWSYDAERMIVGDGPPYKIVPRV